MDEGKIFFPGNQIDWVTVGGNLGINKCWQQIVLSGFVANKLSASAVAGKIL
jgi:hypothetical protein